MSIVHRFFSGTGNSYDLIVTLFTYGADLYWKHQILQLVPRSDSILDLACGTGILTLKLAGQNPGSEIIGVDMMPEYLAEAKKKITKTGQQRIRLICARAEDVHIKKTFDCITSSYIPKYVQANQLVRKISLWLRPGGMLILHDFAYPQRPIFRRLWQWHMAMLRRIGPSLFPQWTNVFCELAEFVRQTKWIPEYTAALESHGFNNIVLNRMTAGSAAILSAQKAE